MTTMTTTYCHVGRRRPRVPVAAPQVPDGATTDNITDLSLVLGFAWLGGALVVPFVGAADASWWFALAGAATWFVGGVAGGLLSWWRRRHRRASAHKIPNPFLEVKP